MSLALFAGECQWLGSRPADAKKRLGESKMTKIRPLHANVLLRRLEESDRTKGGIIIPDTAKEKPAQGEVVAAGTGIRDEQGKIHALAVKEGDIVLFSKWSGTEVNVDGEDLLVVKESDILGIIEGKKKAKAA
jgi:chaperonin GroES